MNVTRHLPVYRLPEVRRFLGRRLVVNTNDYKAATVVGLLLEAESPGRESD